MNALGVGVPVIETERLKFRLPSINDLETEAAFYTTARSAGVGGPKTRAEVFRTLAGIIGHWVMRGYGFWAIDEKATGQYCGRVGLWFPLEWPEPELGWTLMGHAEGRGFAREAAEAARTYAYGALGWTTLISLIARGNTRSEALATRLGARYEGDFDHEIHGTIPVWRHPGPEALA